MGEKLVELLQIYKGTKNESLKKDFQQKIKETLTSEKVDDLTEFEKYAALKSEINKNKSILDKNLKKMQTSVIDAQTENAIIFQNGELLKKNSKLDKALSEINLELDKEQIVLYSKCASIKQELSDSCSKLLEAFKNSSDTDTIINNIVSKFDEYNLSISNIQKYERKVELQKQKEEIEQKRLELQNRKLELEKEEKELNKQLDGINDELHENMPKAKKTTSTKTKKTVASKKKKADSKKEKVEVPEIIVEENNITDVLPEEIVVQEPEVDNQKKDDDNNNFGNGVFSESEIKDIVGRLDKTISLAQKQVKENDSDLSFTTEEIENLDIVNENKKDEIIETVPNENTEERSPILERLKDYSMEGIDQKQQNIVEHGVDFVPNIIKIQDPKKMIPVRVEEANPVLKEKATKVTKVFKGIRDKAIEKLKALASSLKNNLSKSEVITEENEINNGGMKR